uniref:Potassium channel tetramerisation-type BTB domain-containing protein n=1 Tax=Monodelphis domestica TaxID=13616 RepID=A0A5F8H9K3_MONDO
MSRKIEEMSGESVVTSAVPAAATRTTSFKGASPSSKYVKLNVGGALYYTTMQTLTKQDTMLKAMFSGRMEVLTDSEEQQLLPPASLGYRRAPEGGSGLGGLRQ